MAASSLADFFAPLFFFLTTTATIRNMSRTATTITTRMGVPTPTELPPLDDATTVGVGATVVGSWVVGAIVGDIVVGVMVGTLDGLAVGVAVGVAVGTTLGDAVGLPVGVLVGDAVGAVGAAVGTAVGCLEPYTHSVVVTLPWVFH